MQHKFVRFASVFVVFVKRLQCGTGILNTPIYKMQANLKTWGMKILLEFLQHPLFISVQLDSCCHFEHG